MLRIAVGNGPPVRQAAMSTLSRFLLACWCLLVAAHAQAQSGTAMVRRAPTLNGSVEGSVHIATAENVTLNSSAKIAGNLLIPGTPTVQLNGTPVYGGTIDSAGSATPTSHKVILNSGARLQHVVRRADSFSLPAVAEPPQPAGTRSVSLNNSSQSPGDFATLKNLTLNSNVGDIAVPPGTYGNFNANAGSSFTLGIAGSPVRAEYNFQNLTLNSSSELRVVGPVVVTISGGFSTNATVGNATHPAWLKLRVAGGGLSVASNRSVYADLESPQGTLTLNGGSVFVGQVALDRLIVNSNATLRLVAPANPTNQPPTVTLDALAAGTTYTAPATFLISASASDADGSVARVEFYAGLTKIGETTSASPASATVTLATPGRHRLFARAIDDRGAATDSVAVEVRVLPGLPYLAGFEADEGYSVGALHDQLGWSTSGGSARVTIEAAAAGLRSVVLDAATVATVADQEFGAMPSNPGTVFVDFFVKPAAGATAGAGSQFDLDNARLAFVIDGNLGRFAALDGDGSGSGNWRTLAATVATTGGQANEWQRLTTRLDYTAKTWDVFLNGRLLAHDLRFRFGAATQFSGISIQGHPNAPSYFDSLYAGIENSLFSDADHDGMDDAWETAHGINPALNDRSGDADADGLSNILEFSLGTHPTLADTDADGVGDGYEVRHALNPLLADGDEDADWDGLTNRQEFQLGTSSSAFDTDGDELPDALEVAYGFDPLRAQPETQLGVDADGDGLTLAQELDLGTNPTAKDDLAAGGDSDSDGLPDRWEIAHGLNPKVGEALETLNADADADGLTLAQEVQLGTDPAKADTDGDGMSDGFEHAHTLNALANDAEADADGDGLSNFAEFRQGSDPSDYYNGREPEILPFIGGNFDLGARNVLAVRVTDKLGAPLVNAPVVFEVGDDEPSDIALTPGGPSVGRTAEVRTGPGGIARIYLRPPP